MNNFKTYFTEVTKKDILAGLDKVAEQPTAYGLIEVYLDLDDESLYIYPPVVVFGDESTNKFSTYSSQPVLLDKDAIKVAKHAYIAKEDIGKFSIEERASVYITNKQWLDNLSNAGNPIIWYRNLQIDNFLDELLKNLTRVSRVNKV